MKQNKKKMKLTIKHRQSIYLWAIILLGFLMLFPALTSAWNAKSLGYYSSFEKSKDSWIISDDYRRSTDWASDGSYSVEKTGSINGYFYLDEINTTELTTMTFDYNQNISNLYKIKLQLCDAGTFSNCVTYYNFNQTNAGQVNGTNISFTANATVLKRIYFGNNWGICILLCNDFFNYFYIDNIQIGGLKSENLTIVTGGVNITKYIYYPNTANYTTNAFMNFSGDDLSAKYGFGTSLDTGLKTYWNFDETTGTNVTDVAFGTTNGTISTAGQLGWNGILGTSVKINGTLFSNVSFLDNAVLNFSGTNMSWSFWVNHSTPDNNGGTDIRKRVVNSITMNYVFDNANSPSPTSYIHFMQWDDNADNDISVGGAPAQASVDVFQHVVYVYNNVNLTLFVNGSYVASTPYTAKLGHNNDSMNFICVSTPCTTGFYMDEMGLWNRSLTFAEITSLYNSGNAIVYNSSSYSNISSNVVGYTRFPSPVGDLEFFSHIGDLTTADSSLDSTIFKADLTNFRRSYCSNAYTNFCSIPLKFYSATTGIISIDTSHTLGNEGFTENSQSFSTVTVPGAIEKFGISLSYDTLYYTSVGANLIYNNTAYFGTKTGNSNITYFNTSIIIPSTITSTNKTFYWNVTFTNPDNLLENYSSTLNIQNITQVSMDNCTANNYSLYSFRLFDEDARTTEINGTINYIVNLYANGTRNLAFQFNGTSNYTANAGNARVCANNITAPYSSSYQTQYFSSLTGYETETQNGDGISIFTPITTSQNISLFDLLTARSETFKIYLQSADLSEVADAIVVIQRQYVNINQFIQVEGPKTDSNGQTLAHLIPNEIVYNFLIYKNGVLVASFNNWQVKCQNDVSGECNLFLNFIEQDFNIDDFINTGNLATSYSLNQTTRELTFTFQSTDNAVHTIDWIVKKYDGYSNVTICNNTAFGSSGSIMCPIPISYENTSIFSEVFSDNVRAAFNFFSLDTSTPEGRFGGTRVVLGLLAFSTLTLMFLFNSIAVVIGAILGIILISLFRLVDGGTLFGNALTIVWFVAMGVIIIVYLAKRQ